MKPTSAPDTLELARRLVQAIESGDQHGADFLLEALNDGRFEALFNELGKITRELHDTFSTLAADQRLVALAHEHMPDARARLAYVVRKTAEAADSTLTAVEVMQPINDRMARNAASLRAELEAADDAPARRAAMLSHLDEVAASGAEFRRGFTEILLAQAYQDLTGQVIERTIELVGQVEEKLVGLVGRCGPSARSSARATVIAVPCSAAHGPAVSASEQTVTRQADVDELLANLGF